MSLDRPAFQDWLDRYVAAWRSYDPAAIGGLFSDQAVYRYRPDDEPLTGRSAIVASWLEHPDAPGSWEARYEPLAIDGDIHVAHGWTRYLDDAGAVRDAYANIYVVTFDRDGQATSFLEYFAQGPVYQRRARDAAIAAALAAAGVNSQETPG